MQRKIMSVKKQEIAILVCKEMMDLFQNQNTEKLKKIINKYGPNASDEEHFTLLNHAIGMDWPKGFQLLIKSGASLIPTDPEACPPIIQIVQHNMRDLFKILTENKIDLTIADSDGNTVLHHAIWFSNKEIFDVLIDQKVPLNQKNNNGRTPLYFSTQNKDPYYLKQLIDVGVVIDDITKKILKDAAGAIVLSSGSLPLSLLKFII